MYEFQVLVLLPSHIKQGIASTAGYRRAQWAVLE
jgi:hypothetical protein